MPPADQSQTARFGAAASGVVVDVVVRDKRGKPVSNLTAADFTVLEDGVRQKVVAFEPYTPADAPLRVEDAARAAGLMTASPDGGGDCRKGHRSSRWRGIGWSQKDGLATRPPGG